ncbi:caspase family protein [Streptantibioticus rubrisoli]|uniref:caspase family protein n=1 Tax=Streptantibioticus rubrisoli TaxID=1387313 RepID=UPI003557F695
MCWWCTWVYLSCHGVRDASGRLHFAAADTFKRRLASTGVESQWLLDRLDERRARRQALILDCCFSGAFDATGRKGEAEGELRRLLVGHGRGRVVLTASPAGEYSYAGPALPGAEITGSVFTTGLVKGLRTGGADSDNDGLISVEDAYDYVYTYVQAHAAAQTPRRWTYGAEGKILLARNPAGRLRPDRLVTARVTGPACQDGI